MTHKCDQEELPHIRGQGWWLRVPGCNSAGTAKRSYPSPRSGAVAGRSNPLSKAWWKGGSEEIPLVQGKEQWLRFAGAAVETYPTPKVREIQVRR